MTKYLKVSNMLTPEQSAKYAGLINVDLERCMRHADNAIDGLLDLCADIPERGSMVEVGCFAGESTEVFASKFGHVAAVDCWLGSDDNRIEELFDHRIMSRFNNVTKIKLFSDVAARDFPFHSVDMVYIDAAHDYASVKLDLFSWIPAIKKGGYICGHDYDQDDVNRAINDVVGLNVKKYQDGSWLIQL